MTPLLTGCSDCGKISMAWTWAGRWRGRCQTEATETETACIRVKMSGIRFSPIAPTT